MIAKWEGVGEMSEKGEGIRSTNCLLQNIHGDIKNSIIKHSQ